MLCALRSPKITQLGNELPVCLALELCPFLNHAVVYTRLLTFFSDSRWKNSFSIMIWFAHMQGKHIYNENKFHEYFSFATCDAFWFFNNFILISCIKRERESCTTKLVSHSLNGSQSVLWKTLSFSLLYGVDLKCFSTSCLILLDAGQRVCFWGTLLIVYSGPSLWWRGHH